MRNCLLTRLTRCVNLYAPEQVLDRRGECDRATMTEAADINVRSLLETARRAEADGNIDAAIRTYRHITENYARSTEARVAAEALTRRGVGPGAVHGIPGLAMPPPPRANSPAPNSPPLRAAPPTAMILPGPGPAHDRAQHHPAPPPRAAAPHAAAPHHASAAHHPSRDPQRGHHRDETPRYRFGRIIAHVTGFAGGTILVASIAAAAMNLGATFGYVSSPVFASMLIGWPLILMTNAVGLLLVLFGQMARATFDAAEAARHHVP